METYSGECAYGPVYAAAVSVAANVDMARHLVRNAMGDEVISSMTLYLHPDDETSFAPESRVTFGTYTGQVISASPQTLRGHTAFVKVACT